MRLCSELFLNLHSIAAIDVLDVGISGLKMLRWLLNRWKGLSLPADRYVVFATRATECQCPLNSLAESQHCP